MILRVDIDSMGASIDLDGQPWTPELVDTFLRLLGDEVVRLYLQFAESGAIEEEEPTDGDANDTVDLG